MKQQKNKKCNNFLYKTVLDAYGQFDLCCVLILTSTASPDP